MNTKALQAAHSSFYESFFTTQKIIFSTPFVMSWSGEADAWYSGISIKQKIPLRMYIGLTSSSKPGLHFGEIIYREFSDYKFLTTQMYEYAPYFHEIEHFINQSCGGIDKGYNVTILTELPRGIGLGFDSIFSLLLSTAVHRIQNKLESNSFSVEDISEEINKTDSTLYNITRFAHTIESQIKGYQYINGAITTSLSHTSFPVVSYHEDIPNPGKKELLSMYDYKYFSYSLQSLFNEIGENTYIPIDFGIIYSGRPILNEQIVQHSGQNELAAMMEFANNTFKQSVSQTNANRKPRFYKHLVGPYMKGENNIMQSVLGFMSIEVLHALKVLYHKGYTEDDIKKFILAITKTRHAHNAVKKTSGYLSSLITGIQQYCGCRSDILGMLYNENSTIGGSLLFTTPLESLRKNILNTLYQAQRDFPGVELIYTSWGDGVEAKGLICEQDLAQQKTSSYIDSNMLVLETSDKNMLFGSYEELTQEKGVDIVLDTVHMKIFTQGKKLTSKELHSQSGTIELLMTALNNIGIDIPNKKLPLSSYSKSKNDMVGKIVVPLIRLIKERIKKDLPIECYGGMYDYFLRLKKHNVKFGIMRKAIEVEHE